MKAHNQDTMDNRFEPYDKQPADSEILFSKTVKAGKRVYYLDVKRDRRHALYLSITESKRVGNATEGQRPAFEKHKVFLYAEDLQHFAEACRQTVDYIAEHDTAPRRRHWLQPVDTDEAEELIPEPDYEAAAKEESLENFKFNIDF